MLIAGYAQRRFGRTDGRLIFIDGYSDNACDLRGDDYDILLLTVCESFSIMDMMAATVIRPGSLRPAAKIFDTLLKASAFPTFSV